MKITFSSVLLLSSGIILAIILGAVFFSAEPELERPGTAETDMWYTVSTKRLSSMELRSRNLSYIPFTGKKQFSDAKFVYLWISIKNTGFLDREYLIFNESRNYYTELLEPSELGAVTVHRHGDIVPPSQYPVHHTTAVFPVTIPANSKENFIIEYHGPRGIVADPQVTTSVSFSSWVVRSRGRLGLTYGAALGLILLQLLAGIILRQKKFLGSAMVTASVFFFSLRQSRLLLLLISPLTYPEWLFPLSIFFNITASIVFALFLLAPHLTKGLKLMLLTGWAAALITALTSMFAVPYLMADILNLLSLIILVITGAGIFRGIRRRDKVVFWIVLSFTPWIAMMLLDILAGFFQFRFTTQSSPQFLGLLGSVILISITLLKLHRDAGFRLDTAADTDIPGGNKESTSQLEKLAEFRISLFKHINQQLRRPLDGAIAGIRLLQKEFSDPGITSAAKIIYREVAACKQIMGKELKRLAPENDPYIEEKEPEHLPGTESAYANVWIFDSDKESARRTALILRSEGFAPAIAEDMYQVIHGAAKGDIDVLLIEPASTGEQAFTLCGIIRGNHNMLELPILMIAGFQADYLMRKGYAAGVNDFLTIPFDGSELLLRVQTLSKLKEVIHHNSQLARSEKEKNVFLYFLTHNVNTPLTLLINRVRELENLVNLDALDEIVEDLRASSQEINDIVQNILISFRIADGRHTLLIEEMDLESVLGTLRRDIAKKAEMKQQTLTMDIPEAFPTVQGDFTAVRGILYNLLDNAVKFSPPGTGISLAIVPGDPLKIDVRDRGPGISREDRGKLFSRFEPLSTQPTGGESSTGLGLYVAKELARMNGGDLEYREFAEGACFRLTVPLSIQLEDVK
ncbi:MAG: ATP-binding protein [Spirochaetia bacterium]